MLNTVVFQLFKMHLDEVVHKKNYKKLINDREKMKHMFTCPLCTLIFK